MFTPIILGSDKTTVSVATGQNEYWPLYISIGNIRNNVRRAHRGGVALLGFLSIPKSRIFRALISLLTLINQNISQQEILRRRSFPQVQAPTFPYLTLEDPRAPQSGNDNAGSCPLSGRPFPPRDLWSGTVHRRLSRTSTSCMYRSRLVCKVSPPLLSTQYRCQT